MAFLSSLFSSSLFLWIFSFFIFVVLCLIILDQTGKKTGEKRLKQWEKKKTQHKPEPYEKIWPIQSTNNTGD